MKKNPRPETTKPSTEIRVGKRLRDDELDTVSGGAYRKVLLSGPYDDYSGGSYTASGDTKK